MCWVKLGLNVLKDPFQFLNSMRIRTVEWSNCRSQEVSIPPGRPERSWNWNRGAASRRGTTRPSPQLYPSLLFTTQERFVPAPFSEGTWEAVSKIPRMYICDFFCLFPAPPRPRPSQRNTQGWQESSGCELWPLTIFGLLPVLLWTFDLSVENRNALFLLKRANRFSSLL